MLTSILMAIAMTSAAPTNGDLYRELSTNRDLFDQADLNGDGRISDNEFDRYKERRLGESSKYYRPRAGLGGHDFNNDNALTPYELYPEADYRIIGASPTWVNPQTQDDDAPYND